MPGTALRWVRPATATAIAIAIAEAATGIALLMVPLLFGRLLLSDILAGSWNLVTAMADEAIACVNRMQ